MPNLRRSVRKTQQMSKCSHGSDLILSFILHFRMEFESLKSHIKVVHCTVAKKKEKFPCKVCAKVYTDSDAFTKHTWTHMNETLTRVQCDICQRWLKNHHILRIHKQYHQTTPLECRHCGKIKYNNRSMKVHITAAHSTRKHKCNLCDKTFRRPISLKVFTQFEFILFN